MTVDQLEIILLSDAVTFILSAGISLVSFAVKWGAMKEQVQQVQSNMATKTEVGELSKDLAEIKGMFVLRLRD